MKYVLKRDGQFFITPTRVTAEYPNATIFDSYDAAHDFLEALQDIDGIELIGDYGLDTETVEDV